MVVNKNNLFGKTFLIAEDEKMLRELIVLEFEEFGVKCLEANDGKEALAIFKNNDIDGILSDIRMPGGSGIELLQDLKNESLARDIPILLMSGFTDFSIRQAKDLGAITILAKPFIFDEIMEMLTGFFKSS